MEKNRMAAEIKDHVYEHGGYKFKLEVLPKRYDDGDDHIIAIKISALMTDDGVRLGRELKTINTNLLDARNYKYIKREVAENIINRYERSTER